MPKVTQLRRVGVKTQTQADLLQRSLCPELPYAAFSHSSGRTQPEVFLAFFSRGCLEVL